MKTSSARVKPASSDGTSVLASALFDFWRILLLFMAIIRNNVTKCLNNVVKQSQTFKYILSIL